MKKTMYEVTVENKKGVITLSSPDPGQDSGEQSVSFTIEQADTVIRWIREAVEDDTYEK